MKTCIVTTTINVPSVLLKYKPLGAHIIVIGDMKTPDDTKIFCESNDFEYLDTDDQMTYLEKFPELFTAIPFNCIQRRNIGILKAYEDGYEKIITIDDDNELVNLDYLDEHFIGEKNSLVISNSGGWFNVCAGLKEKSGRAFYHRGFPLEKRKDIDLMLNNFTKIKKTKIVVNAGLWLGDPDIDALTRLYNLADPITAVDYDHQNFCLESGTWSPFNSQNTALSREVIPAYFLFPNVGRFDDIWASYIVRKIADHLGHYVSYGAPLVTQERNPHNYWNDLDKEFNLGLTMQFVNKLQAINLTGKTYAECYKEIYEQLDGFNVVKDGMLAWIKTMNRLSQS